MDSTTLEVIQDVCSVLNSLFQQEKAKYQNDYYGEMKVRPYFADGGTFYMTEVEELSDSNLLGLIHLILINKGHHMRLLSKEAFKELKDETNLELNATMSFLAEHPETDTYNTIEWYCINYTGRLFYDNDMMIHNFINAGYDLQPELQEIAGGSYIFDNVCVIPLFKFANDVKEYVSNHKLDEEQIADIKTIYAPVDDLKQLTAVVEALVPSHLSLAKEIMVDAVYKAKKNSDLSLMAIKVKKLFGDEAWANEIKKKKRS